MDAAVSDRATVYYQDHRWECRYRGPSAGTLLVLPWTNIVGIQDGTRGRPNGDLNRQFPLEEHPTTDLAREIWNSITEYDPDLLIDLHELVGQYIDGRLSQSIDAQENYIHPRFLPSPADPPGGVLVQRTAFELGIPTYIIETYDGLRSFCARAMAEVPRQAAGGPTSG